MGTDDPMLCRAEYKPFGDSALPTRIVRCNLPAGHEGDHDEMIDGEPGVVMWPVKQPGKRTDDNLTVGTLVRKVGGDYTLTGTVVAVFPKLSGQVRYVVETGDGLLLIYSRTNLEVCDGD